MVVARSVLAAPADITDAIADAVAEAVEREGSARIQHDAATEEPAVSMTVSPVVAAAVSLGTPEDHAALPTPAQAPDVEFQAVADPAPVPLPVAALPAPSLPPSQDSASTEGPQSGPYIRMTMMETTMNQSSKAAETMFKAAEEAAEFGRGNVEAMTRATQIYFSGVQDLGRQGFAMMQGLTEQAIEGAKALTSVKSLQEAAQIQSNLARAAMEKSVAESARFGEQALKLTEQAFAPLNARFSMATEKLGRMPATV